MSDPCKRETFRIPAGTESPHWVAEATPVIMNNESRLFVGNLSFGTEQDDLQNHFAQAGAVSSVALMFDKFTGKSRGFAFVEMASAEEAKKAVELFHNKEFQGRPLTVNIARPREDRPRGGDRPQAQA